MRRYQAYSAERKRRADAKLADSWFGARLGRLVNSGLDNVRSGLSWRAIGREGADAARNRIYQEDNKLVDEAAKRRNMASASIVELQRFVANGSKGERGAALKELATRGNATRTHLADVRTRFGADSQVVRDFESKMRSYDPMAVFTGSSGGLDTARLEGFIQSNQFDIKKLGRESLTGDMLRAVLRNGKASQKDLDELRSNYGGDAVRDALSDAINAETADMGRRGEFWDFDPTTNPQGLAGANFHKNIQRAFLAQGGNFHGSIRRSRTARRTLIEGARVDDLKRFNSANLAVGTPNGDENLNALAETMGGNYSDMLLELSKNGPDGMEAARRINRFILSGANTSPNAVNLGRVARNDQRIQHLR